MLDGKNIFQCFWSDADPKTRVFECFGVSPPPHPPQPPRVFQCFWDLSKTRVFYCFYEAPCYFCHLGLAFMPVATLPITNIPTMSTVGNISSVYSAVLVFFGYLSVYRLPFLWVCSSILVLVVQGCVPIVFCLYPFSFCCMLLQHCSDSGV